MREAESVDLDRLRYALPRAGLPLLPEAYLRRVRRVALAALAGGLVIALLLIALAQAGLLRLSPPGQVALALAALFVGFLTYRAGLLLPDVRASLRASRLDGKLPYAVNYLSTMSSGNLGLDEMFAQVGLQDVYGPVAHEARIIHRDITLLGLDTAGALRAAIDRSPSIKFQDFLQGLLTTISSGGDLRLFLEAKSEQYFAENRTMQARFLDRLGLLAEVFVVLVVAAPLFVIVLLSVLTLFGRGGSEVLLLGYALVVLILPLAHAAFAGTIRALQPEA